MSETTTCQFEVEVHPPGWTFPAGKTWVAGWFAWKGDRVLVDLRAKIGSHIFLAIHGLPKPGLDEKLTGHAGPPYSGFVLQLTPERDAKLLTLEARDADGPWQEFFRTPVNVAVDRDVHATASVAASQLEQLTGQLLRAHAQRPAIAMSVLADYIVSSALAIPLNSLPNPPFQGALEEPVEIGQVRYGRLVVTGWLAHENRKIVRLTALADSLQESVLLHGLHRDDVGQLFSQLPGREQSQFVGQVDLPPGTPAPALLKIFAELDNGEKHLAFAQRFKPQSVSGADTTLPPRSRITFAKAAWALHGAIRRHAYASPDRAATWIAMKAAWTAYQKNAPQTDRMRMPAARQSSFNERIQRPLRLLIVTHNLNFEGAPRLVFELSSYLLKQPGATARVLSPHEGPMRQLFENAGMPVEIVDLSSTLKAITEAEFQAELNKAVNVDWSQVDLVIANSMASFWAIHAAQRAHKPSLFYVHESAPLARFFGESLSSALLTAVEAAFRDATRVVFTAEASLRVFASLNTHDHFRVLPSWLDVAAIDAFVATHTKAALRTKHQIPADALVLLNLGTVCERKGQHNFIRAAALMKPSPNETPVAHAPTFVMVGAREDGFLALLRLQATDAGLTNVRFVPETRENFDWLRLADILVCTSFEESSPRVLLEAAAFNLPVVSTNVNGIPELLSSAEAVLLPPGDPHRLASALRTAIADVGNTDSSRIEKARRVVEARFDERVSLPQHLALANEVLATYSRPHA